MAPPRRKACRRAAQQHRRKKNYPPAGKNGPNGRATSRSASSSYSSTSSGSSDEDTNSSDECSDEDDPRDYKRGGYHPVMPYQMYNGRYRVLSKLGAGAFSTVWLCADERTSPSRPDGPDLVAMKVCKSKKSVTEQALDEILLLEQLQRNTQPDHVVQMRGHFWHSGPYGRHKCMVFEVMGENLLALVKHYDYNGVPMNMVRRLAMHTLIGLEYIHARGVIHTDVKLENVLIQRHDLAELATEACKAHKAFTAQRELTGALSKSQKKRQKKKAKAKANAAKEKEDEIEEDGDVADVTEGTSATSAAGAAGSSAAGNAANPEEAADSAAAQALGRPVPPIRQRDRFDTLQTEKVFAKLADFGNGVLADRKVTDDIQTRQYRSPEIIIGAEWNETADVWSAACMFFELITGDFLFDPRTGEDWSRDEDHLALMIELLGGYPPKEWAQSGKYAREFLTRDNKLKHINKLKFWELPQVLEEKYQLDESDAKEIADFLLPMLTWEPSKRQAAKDAQKHPWLQKWDQVSSDEEDCTECSDDDSEADEPAIEETEEQSQPRASARRADEVKEDQKPAEASDEATASTSASGEASSSADTPPALVPEPKSIDDEAQAGSPVPQNDVTEAKVPAAVSKSKALKKGKGIGGGYPVASSDIAAVPVLVPAPAMDADVGESDDTKAAQATANKDEK